MVRRHSPIHPKEAIVRIFSPSGDFFGTGCLEATGLIVTCAHVIRDALGLYQTTADLPRGKVGIDFPFLEDLRQDDEDPVPLPFSAELAPGGWGPSLGVQAFNDIAILRLERAPPFRCGCIFPDSEPNDQDLTVYVHGFRNGGAAEGEPVDGKIAGNSRGPNGLWIFDSENCAYVVNAGFSGAPIFPANTGWHGNGAVGMLIGEPQKGTSTNEPLREPKRVAIIIPAKRIRAQIETVYNEVEAERHLAFKASRPAEIEAAQAQAAVAQKRLSDRLNQDDYLKPEFNSFKDKWKQLAVCFPQLPGLFVNWSEYCDRLDQIAYNLIPADWSAEDIFILCCALYLHKINLVPKSSASQQIHYVYSQYRRRSPPRIRYGQVRHVHGQSPLASRSDILELGKDFGLDEERTEDIAWVCYGHRDLVNKKRSSTPPLIQSELMHQVKKGCKTRAELSYYLRILAQLGAFNPKLSPIAAKLYFKDKSSSDYAKFRMDSVISDCHFEGAEYQVSLKAHLSETDPVGDIRLLKKIKEQLEDIFRKPPAYMRGNPFEHVTVDLDPSVFSAEVRRVVSLTSFTEIVHDSIRRSIKALLKSRYQEGNSPIKGWGPVIFGPRDAPPFCCKFPNEIPPCCKFRKELQEARVANTAEVFLAFAGWLEIASQEEVSVAKVLAEINEVVPTLKFAQAKKNHASEFNPLVSLTFGARTSRANGLFVMAATHLLKNMGAHPALMDSEVEIRHLARECIGWLCNAETGPFREQIIARTHVTDEYLFQCIQAFRALINAQDYWPEPSVGVAFDEVIQKIADFVHFFMHHRSARPGWPLPVFKAMMIEILLFYYSQTNSQFSHKPQVEKLIKTIAQDLLNAIDLKNSPVWEDDTQVLRDEDCNNIRPWIHVTSAWAIEGLARCVTAGLLTPEQKIKMLQTLTMVLLKQDDDGFYETVPCEDDPHNIVEHCIYKTALYTYALAQVEKALRTPKPVPSKNLSFPQ